MRISKLIYLEHIIRHRWAPNDCFVDAARRIWGENGTLSVMLFACVCVYVRPGRVSISLLASVIFMLAFLVHFWLTYFGLCFRIFGQSTNRIVTMGLCKMSSGLVGECLCWETLCYLIVKERAMESFVIFQVLRNVMCNLSHTSCLTICRNSGFKLFDFIHICLFYFLK